ncbi:hypothetical protein REPUB_Repub16aG0044000 [Reevesia pubescens]
MSDLMIWGGTNDSQFTVKSTYHVARQYLNRALAWRAIDISTSSYCMCTPENKSLLYVFFYCAFIKAVWKKACPWLEAFITPILPLPEFWAPFSVVSAMTKLKEEYLSVHGAAGSVMAVDEAAIKWIPPPGILKMNVDVAYDERSNSAKLGLVVRDSNGSTCYAAINKLRFIYSPLHAEMLAILFDLPLANENLTQLNVDGDSMLTVKRDYYGIALFSACSSFGQWFSS